VKYVLNGTRDLGFDGAIKPYLWQEVEFVRVCKSGLIQVKAVDGTLLSVPRRNLNNYSHEYAQAPG
jgi:hypothetical protein